jgi:hypothetical protein
MLGAFRSGALTVYLTVFVLTLLPARAANPVSDPNVSGVALSELFRNLAELQIDDPHPVVHGIPVGSFFCCPRRRRQ